jgi:hypothetical protein
MLWEQDNMLWEQHIFLCEQYIMLREQDKTNYSMALISHRNFMCDRLIFTMFLRLSHRPLYYTIFTVCRHLGSDPDLPETILKGDYPRTIVTKLDSR